MGGVIAAIAFKSGTESFPELTTKNLRDFDVLDIDGQALKIESLVRGKRAALFVNVATKWGLTEEKYNVLNKLYEKYREDGLEIIAFPCNQFGNMEPGTNAEIKEFASECYGAQFPMMSKSEVNG